MGNHDQAVPSEQDNRVAIGRRIKNIRQAQNITLQELAAKAGMSPGFISEVERGLASISTPKLMDICRALGVSTSAVLEERPPSGPATKTVAIPAALSELAETYNLSHRVVLQLLQGRLSLRAKRSQGAEKEWGTDEWLRFYQRVQEYIDDEEGPADGSTTRDGSGRAPP